MKLTHNLAAKIVACFLVIFFGLCTIGSGTAFFLSDVYGFTGGNAKSFADTPACRDIIYDDAWNLAQWYNGSPSDTKNILQHYGKNNTNFRFNLLNEKGELLLTNIEKGETPSSVWGYDFYLEKPTSTDGEFKEAEYLVECYLNYPLTANDDYVFPSQMYQFLYNFDHPLPIAIGSLIITLAALIFLFCAAGHRADTDEIVPNLNDKIPFDLYVAVMGIGFLCCCLMFASLFTPRNLFTLVVMIGAVALAGIFLLATLLTFATRLKMGKWWRNTLTYRILHFFWRIAKSILLVCLDTLTGIPLVWKVALAWIIISIPLLAGGFFSAIINLALLFLFCNIALQLQKLKKGGEELSKGHLSYKVDTARMFRTFKQHGEHLNTVSKGFSIAVNQKMKSERMKTELITNVSHDIKTPLTSIINYVDLLKKENLDGKAAEYIEVLDRQSNRLKKLTEDLVEASKASTGNMKVNLMPSDMGELAAQAVAEYDEKLQLAKLQVVLNGMDTPVYAMVDGNLTWRVLSNLLSNACKYSQPHTRLYIDIKESGDQVTLSMKNTSRDALNIPAEELMERFVRNDSSRHTEGSGLGLNIAQSLVNLQKGKFSLSIDGDLFKAEMVFPKADPPTPPEEDLPVDETSSEEISEEEIVSEEIPAEDVIVEDAPEENE